MRKLGISIYPEKSTKKELFDYIDIASEYGFSRIFSCLLSAEEPKEEIIKHYSEINHYARKKKFEIIVDVSPRIFERLHINYDDLTFFKQLGADGLRLDLGFTGSEESLMTFNEHGLSIEINMSNNVHTIDTIMDYRPNQYQLLASHNFYPHRHTGLSLEFFKKCSARFNQYGLRTSAFVSSNNVNTFGPWPVTDGLPTLEIHRNLPLDIQVKHYIAMNIIDDIVISNCFASVEEMRTIKKLDLSVVTFDVFPVPELPDTERKIMFDMLHFNRGDVNENLIRSTQSRVKYKGCAFPVFHAPKEIKRGDIIIESSEYGHYAGEMQIALTNMQNSGKSNIVGSIRPEEHFILDELKPWQKFKLKLSQ